MDVLNVPTFDDKEEEKEEEWCRLISLDKFEKNSLKQFTRTVYAVSVYVSV